MCRPLVCLALTANGAQLASDVLMTSLTFSIAKRRKIEGPVRAFSDPDADNAPPAPTEAEKTHVARVLQDEGNRHAEAGQFSAAIRLYDR